MSKEQKKLVRSGTLSLMTIYLTFLFSIANTYFIARLLSPETWGLLLFFLTVIGTTSFFCTFLPPSAEATLQYYIPLFKKEKNNSNSLRGFIFNIYKIRLGLIIFVFIIFHLIIYSLNLSEVIIQALAIISPMIIFLVLQNLNNSLLNAFQRFKKVFIVNFVNAGLYTMGIMIIFLQDLSEPLILIVLVNVLSSLVSFFISIMFIIQVIPRKSSKSIIPNSIQKVNYRKIHEKYGLFLTMSGLLSNVLGLITSYMILAFGFIAYLTYISICYTFVEFAENFSGSSKGSYTSIFSEVNLKNDLNQFRILIYQINKYLLLSVSLVVGILFFFSEVVIFFIYTEIYLVTILGIQLFLLSAFPRVIIRNFIMISHSTNRTKISFYMTVFQTFGNLIVTLIVLLFFGFYTLILLYFMIIILESLLGVYLINRKSNFKFSYYLIYKPFLIFFFSIMIISPLIFFFNLNLFQNIDIINRFFNSLLKAIVFFFVYYLIIYFTKYITKEEYNQLVEIIPIIKSQNKYIQRFNKIIVKAFPSGTKIK